MGRPRKSHSAEQLNTLSEGENIVKDAPSNTDELAALKAENAEIKALLQQLLAEKKQGSVAPQSVQNPYDDWEDEGTTKIPLDDHIKVISLCANQLNLSTKGYGRGKIYTFLEFGQVKRILYQDLIDIIESHSRFLEMGLFYIADKRVIKRHGLDEIYEKIMDKKTIELVLAGHSEDTVSLFKSATKGQQEVIIDLLVEKAANDPESVDHNLIDKIARASGVKIQEKIDDFIEFFKKQESA